MKAIPILNLEAAEYLVSKKVRYVVMERISPEGDSTNIHNTPMGGGVAIFKNVQDLRK